MKTEKEKLLEKFEKLKAPEEIKVKGRNIFCSNCFYCSDCSNCSNCSNCSDCFYCSYCSYCYDCFDCFDCSNCSYCYDCSCCSNCSYCYDCSCCSDCLRLKNGLLCKELKFEYGTENAYNSNKFWLLNQEVSKEKFEKAKKVLYG